MDGSFVTNNGMLIMTCNNCSSYHPGILVSVDINGRKKKPNRYGWDLFTFEVKDGEVIPVGSENTTFNQWRNNPAYFCSSSSTIMREFAGITCSYFASSEDDYFSKLYQTI